LTDPPPANDCRACGACCLSDALLDRGYVRLFDGEIARLRRRGLPVLAVGRTFRRGRERTAALGTVVDGTGARRYAALKGEVGRRCSCRVYDERPRVCREFEPGTPECLGARRRAGLAG
jgi:hypothetical protein